MKRKKNKKKRNKNSNTILISCLILLVIGSIVGLTIIISNHKRKEIVITKQKSWNIFNSQNYSSEGTYQGFFYIQPKSVTNLNPTELSILLVDNYIDNYNFFNDKNKTAGPLYQKEISYTTVDKIFKSILGPDRIVEELADISYGCGRKLQATEKSVIISAKDPESCGDFSEKQAYYKTYISSYKRSKNTIKITLKVAFITNEEDIDTYKVYQSKNKRNLLSNNYPINCLSEDSEKCAKAFINYQVILAKASDGNYYFSSIRKA